jgi:hypothetical protein
LTASVGVALLERAACAITHGEELIGSRTTARAALSS